MLLNCGVGEDSWESFGLQGDPKGNPKVNPKGNQSWTFIGRTDAEAPMLCAPDAKSQLIGKDWCWKRLKTGGEGPTENKMVRWHHWLNGHEFEQALGESEGQGSPGML